MPFFSSTVTALILLAIVAISGSLQAQSARSLQQSLSIGAYYAVGDYGEPENTEIDYFPVSYAANIGQWGFQLLVPRLAVTGLGNVLVNIGGLTRAVAGTKRVTERGTGDVVATLTYRFEPESTESAFFDVRMDVKFPTANASKNLGTGETDFSIQLDMSKNVANNVVFATIGHNFRGKSELYPGLEDGTFLQLGMARPVRASWSVGVFYDYRQAASDFSDESHELVPYFTWQLSERWSFTGLTSVGFTNASADHSVMGQLNYQW